MFLNHQTVKPCSQTDYRTFGYSNRAANRAAITYEILIELQCREIITQVDKLVEIAKLIISTLELSK